MLPSCCFQGLVTRTDTAWGARHGAGLRSARGTFMQPTADLLAAIASLDTQVRLLADEINHSVSLSDVTTTAGAAMIRLQADYVGFQVRWDVWSKDEQSDAWLLSAKSTLDEFATEFGSYRTRYTGLGGKTVTQAPPPPGSPLGNFATGAGQVLASVVVASAIAGGAYLLFFRK